MPGSEVVKTKSKSLSMHTDSARGFAGTLSSPANGGATPALMLARRALAAGLRSDEDHRRTSFNFIRKALEIKSHRLDSCGNPIIHSGNNT